MITLRRAKRTGSPSKSRSLGAKAGDQWAETRRTCPPLLSLSVSAWQSCHSRRMGKAGQQCGAEPSPAPRRCPTDRQPRQRGQRRGAGQEPSPSAGKRFSPKSRARPSLPRVGAGGQAAGTGVPVAASRRSPGEEDEAVLHGAAAQPLPALPDQRSLPARQRHSALHGGGPAPRRGAGSAAPLARSAGGAPAPPGVPPSAPGTAAPRSARPHRRARGCSAPPAPAPAARIRPRISHSGEGRKEGGMEGRKKKFEMPKLPDPGPAGQSRKFTVDISCRPDFTSEAAGQSRAGEESTGTRPPSLTISTAPSEPNFAREGLSAAPQHSCSWALPLR